MTLSAETIGRRLRRSAATDEWLVREVETTTTVQELGRGALTAQRVDHSFEVAILSDRRSTRGEARFRIDADADGDLSALLTSAEARARENSGPQWRLPRPAAPARVRVADQRLVSDPLGAIGDIAATLATPGPGVRTTSLNVTVATTRHRFLLSSEFEHSYTATDIAISGALAIGTGAIAATAPLELRKRRFSDLDLTATLAAASATLAQSAGATQTASGTYDLILSSEALRGGADLNRWLSPLAAQAAGELALRGLSRYQPGQRAVAAEGGDPVNVASDGTVDYALESAPLDEWGGPVRRFRLIEAGVAAALALNSREAALRGAPGNGGARNLVLGTGTRTLDQLTDGALPRLIVTSLEVLAVNAATGEIAGQIGLASSPETAEALTGGHFTFDIFEALGRVRLATESKDDPHGGPAWIAIPNVRVA